MLEEVRPRSVLSEVRAAKGAPEEKMVVMI